MNLISLLTRKVDERDVKARNVNLMSRAQI